MRECGILLPVTSIPSPYGIGGFGEAAYQFVDQAETGRAAVLAGASFRPYRLRGFTLSVFQRLCRKSLFY